MKVLLGGNLFVNDRLDSGLEVLLMQLPLVLNVCAFMFLWLDSFLDDCGVHDLTDIGVAGSDIGIDLGALLCVIGAGSIGDNVRSSTGSVDITHGPLGCGLSGGFSGDSLTGRTGSARAVLGRPGGLLRLAAGVAHLVLCGFELVVGVMRNPLPVFDLLGLVASIGGAGHLVDEVLSGLHSELVRFFEGKIYINDFIALEMLLIVELMNCGCLMWIMEGWSPTLICIRKPRGIVIIIIAVSVRRLL